MGRNVAVSEPAHVTVEMLSHGDFPTLGQLRAIVDLDSRAKARYLLFITKTPSHSPSGGSSIRSQHR